MAARDTQRQRVYDAELVIHGYRRDVLTIEECQALVDRALASAYIQRKFKRAATYHRRGVRVIHGRNGGWAHPGTAEISLGRWGRQPTIVLHELAHIIAGIDGITPAHGWHFCEVYLVLVRRFVGVDVHDKLKESFRKHGVRFTKPRAKRTLTPEQRERALANLAAARKTPVGNKVDTWTPTHKYERHICSVCGDERIATKFPTTRTPGEREERCRGCRDGDGR